MQFITKYNDFFDLYVGSDETGHISSSKHNENMVEETANLPLVIRERDVRYQFKRIVLYRRLLEAYPYTRPNIWKEARIDSLPLYRAYIWAAVLGMYRISSRISRGFFRPKK